jgi:histidyl-tRNA synthetase
MQKQFKYADNRTVQYVALIGDNELKDKIIQLKNMISGEQIALTESEFMNYFNH